MEEQGVHRPRSFSGLWVWVKGLGKFFRLPTSSLSDSVGAPSSEAPVNPENESMRRRVDELERRLAALEAERGQSGVPIFKPISEIWKPALLVLGTVFLAIVPSAWVVWHRWLSHPNFPRSLKQWWDQSQALRFLYLPPYFLIIFACVIGVILLIWFNREGPWVSFSNLEMNHTKSTKTGISSKQARMSRIVLVLSILLLAGLMLLAMITHTIPGLGYAIALLLFLMGWALREITPDQVKSIWEQKKRLIIAVAFTHLAIVAFLTAFYTPSLGQTSWIFGMVLILALINLLPYIRKVHPIFWIISLALILFTININAWWFAVIGDEYSFYDHVRLFTEKQPFSYIASHLFSGLAVEGTHPYMSTLIQYIIMKIAGHNNFGWRFSSLYLGGISIGLLYYFFKTFIPKRIALLASFFMMASTYLMTFGKIGYNNLQALFALALVLAATAWVFSSRRLLAYVVVGFTMGFCFYVYPAAIYAAPLPILFLLIHDFPKSQPVIRRWVLMLAAFFLLLFPLLLQQGYWEAKVPGTFFNNPELTQSTSTIVQHYTTNLVYAFFSFLYNPQESHFLVYSDVDPLSAVFIFIGLAYLIKKAPKSRFLAFILISFVLYLIVVGASHDRMFPPNTRMFLFLPWWILFAAVGVTWLMWQIRNLFKGQASITPYLSLILVGVLGFNLYQSYPLMEKRWGPSHGIDYLYFRIATKAQKIEHLYPTNFVFVTDTSWGPDGFKTLQWVYGIPSSPSQLNKVVVDGPLFPDSSKNILEDARSLVIVHPQLNADWQTGLAVELQNMGKSVCDIKTNDGQTRFQMWYTGAELANLCNE
jgi:4-amino-4-deoxy-L-arabinose transferase-like glycosyltransferase